MFILGNTLFSRVFASTTDGAWATWDLQTSHGSALRAMSPEAIVTLDNISYNIGGLVPVNSDGSPCIVLALNEKRLKNAEFIGKIVKLLTLFRKQFDEGAVCLGPPLAAMEKRYFGAFANSKFDSKAWYEFQDMLAQKCHILAQKCRISGSNITFASILNVHVVCFM